MASANLIKLLMITGEIFGKAMSPDAARVFAEDLSEYPEEGVLKALAKCRKELKTFPSISDIVNRIDDGRPGVEEAWAMLPKHESDSVVWTDEMATAFGVCRMLIEKDPIAARLAFKESYTRLVSEARANARSVNWTPSLGHSKSGRESAIKEAVAKGRLTSEQAQIFLPDYSTPPMSIQKLLKQIPKEIA
jgi:hypothetical protein